jgi:hypothetical protein
MVLAEDASAPAERRADGIDDDDFSHMRIPWRRDCLLDAN